VHAKRSRNHNTEESNKGRIQVWGRRLEIEKVNFALAIQYETDTQLQRVDDQKGKCGQLKSKTGVIEFN